MTPATCTRVLFVTAAVLKLTPNYLKVLTSLQLALWLLSAISLLVNLLLLHQPPEPPTLLHGAHDHLQRSHLVQPSAAGSELEAAAAAAAGNNCRRLR